jgi:hypothetical protein
MSLEQAAIRKRHWTVASLALILDAKDRSGLRKFRAATDTNKQA